VVSQVVALVVSQSEEEGGQHDAFSAAGAGCLKTFTATMANAARMMTAKIILVSGLLFFGGQHSPSQPQSLVFCKSFSTSAGFSFSSMILLISHDFHYSLESLH
jgi:hypothetical protein